MQRIITADKTETFLNEIVGETYHSQTGAVEEAFKKYAIPCKIKELTKTGKIRILDICFGLGYNSAAAMDTAWEENPACPIEIIGLENDREILNKIKEVNPPIKHYSVIQKLKEEKDNLIFQNQQITVKVLVGDARERIKELPADFFDAVFLDPFSPKTAPEMWQVPFFREIYRVLKEKRVLATYTCARLARDNLKEAGFVYDDGPIVGRRGPGTVAWKWVY